MREKESERDYQKICELMGFSSPMHKAKLLLYRSHGAVEPADGRQWSRDVELTQGYFENHLIVQKTCLSTKEKCIFVCVRNIFPHIDVQCCLERQNWAARSYVPTLEGMSSILQSKRTFGLVWFGQTHGTLSLGLSYRLVIFTEFSLVDRK